MKRNKTYVVGSTLEALIYAYNNNLPTLFAELESPERFDYLDSETDLSPILIENESRILHTPDKDKVVGLEKRILWNKLYFMLSLAGLIPCGESYRSVRIDGDLLQIATNLTERYYLPFDKLIVFSDKKILGLPHPNSQTEKTYKVVDWFRVLCGTKHEFDMIQTEDDFLQDVLFYPSDRFYGSIAEIKDAVTFSYLKKSQLNQYEYSDVNARFKLKDMMKKAGIKGKLNSYHPVTREPKYLTIKLENLHREIIPLSKNIYEDTDKLEFKNNDKGITLIDTPNPFMLKLLKYMK